MTADDFRKLALNLPEAVESSHMGTPDFRVGGKIFATLAGGEVWGMVKLTPEQQVALVASEPKTFQPVKGGWGRMGCTQVILKTAKKTAIRNALGLAWRNRAPKKLAEKYEDEV